MWLRQDVENEIMYDITLLFCSYVDEKHIKDSKNYLYCAFVLVCCSVLQHLTKIEVMHFFVSGQSEPPALSAIVL